MNFGNIALRGLIQMTRKLVSKDSIENKSTAMHVIASHCIFQRPVPKSLPYNVWRD